MKRKITIWILSTFILLGIVFSGPDYSYADNFDFYYYDNGGVDYDYYDVLDKDTFYYNLLRNYDKYFQEFRKEYYNLKDISDYRVANRDASSTEVMAAIDKYVSTEIGLGNELIDTALAQNSLENPEEFYTVESYAEYMEAYDNISEFKENRFVIKEDLLDKIEVLEIAYQNLIPKVIDKSKLETLIQQAETFSSEDYTYESYKNLEKVLQEANSILYKDDATQYEVVEAEYNLKLGILNLRNKIEIVYIENPKDIKVTQNSEIPILPETLQVRYKDGTFANKDIIWNIDPLDTTLPGEFIIYGSINGTSLLGQVKIIVEAVLNTTGLEDAISLGEEKLLGDISVVEKSNLDLLLANAKDILENSNLQSDIDQMETEIRQFIDGLKGNPVMTNIQPNVDINVQPGGEVIISFDSVSGGVANYNINIPSVRPMGLQSVSNMRETRSGHYEGIWIAPVGVYGSFEISLSLETSDGELLSGQALGSINIINDYVVTYKIGNEVIMTEAVKNGGNPINVPILEKEGYTFSHWTLNGEEVIPKDVVISEDIEFEAVLIPKEDYSYTINYLDNDSNELATSKFYDNQVYGTEIVIEGIEIPGYILENDTITIVVGEEDIVNFRYTPRTDIEYTVKFIANGQEIKEPIVQYGEYNKENEVKTVYIPGYNPIDNKSTIFIDKLENNEITIEYTLREDIPYTVEHIERLADGSEIVRDNYSRFGTFNEEIIIYANEYRGLVADSKSKTIVLDKVENNVVSLYYIPDDSITFTINYTNRQEERWSMDIPAEYQNKVTSDDIRDIEIIYQGQRYEIEEIDNESILIDDRSELNTFNVKVYKVYQIEDDQELTNILNEANSLNRPNYSEGNREWDLYWNQLLEAKDRFQNTPLNEDNIVEVKNNLVESIVIIKSIQEFDNAWGDRVAPKGFAKTINDQALSPDYFGRLKAYFNRYTSTIIIGMSDEQKEKSFAGGALGVGVKGAMLNVLKTENLYTVESRGVEAEIRDSYGQIYSDSDLTTSGMELAYKWLPEGANPFVNKWKELIDIEPVEFIMNGVTSPGGESFTRTYYFEFVNIDEI